MKICIYGDLAERVDFAHWWSLIGKGLHLQPAQQACFIYFFKVVELVGGGSFINGPTPSNLYMLHLYLDLLSQTKV